MKEAHRILAIIYGSRGDKKRAADNIESYLRLAPTAPDAEKLRSTLKQLRETGE
jgi:regulator of sirC expression with transglutaminase-like and TPR domain